MNKDLFKQKIIEWFVQNRTSNYPLLFEMNTKWTKTWDEKKLETWACE